MQVESTMNQSISGDKPRQHAQSSTADFANQLKVQQNFNEKHSQKTGTVSSTMNSISTTLTTIPEPESIKLGTLSNKNATVAQLLLANPELKSKTWSIIHNPVNKNKAFHQISAGKEVYYNQKTQELHWSDSKMNKFNSSKRPIFSATSLADKSVAVTADQTSIEKKSINTSITAEKMILGKIDHNNPTVSNLLSQQSDYKAQRWDIIHSKVNQDKAFTEIPNGTTIYIDSKTKELFWNQSITENHLKNSPPITDQKSILARKLDDAVKPFMGTEYKHLDCYTLVVNGLENMGIKYRGKGSLSSQLLQRAQTDGRVQNAYFTGEGLTDALGDKVYTKAISSVNDISQQSHDIFQEMKSLMQKGDILSFSLQTKGHTGVISQNNDQWTYINSGRLDHSINKNSPRHGVGEETLLNEINNWVKLAQQRKEPLQITVGRLDKQKFA